VNCVRSRQRVRRAARLPCGEIVRNVAKLGGDLLADGALGEMGVDGGSTIGLQLSVQIRHEVFRRKCVFSGSHDRPSA
jgi:hypothetical protein